MAKTSRVSLWASIAAAALATAAAAQGEQKPLRGGDGSGAASRNPFNDDFADFARETLDNWKVPGVAVSVVDDEDVYAEGYGLASFPDTPATPDTIWYGASTSKAQLAAVVAHLIDSGAHPDALSAGWDTPLSSLIRDDFVLQDEWATAHLTLEDAVSHRTGMPRHDLASAREVAVADDKAGGDGSRAAGPRDVVRNLRNLALADRPRVRFHYCNLMFVALSHAVEALTGRWLGDVLRETLWAPLGMASTFFDVDEALAAPGHFADGYVWDAREARFREVPKMGVAEVSGAGGVLSTARDYARWVKCLVHEAAPLSEAVHKDIKRPRIVGTAEAVGGVDLRLYSLGWQRTLFRGKVVYTHSGGMHAYGAEVYWLPEHKYGVVAFGNTAVTSNAAEEVLAWRLIQDKLGIPREQQFDFDADWRKRADDMKKRYGDEVEAVANLYPDRPNPPLPPTVNTSSLVGTYYDAGYGSFTLREEPNPANRDETILVADRLDMTWKYQLRLHHVSADYWIVYVTRPEGKSLVLDDYTRGWFVIGADGKVSGLNVHWDSRMGEMDQGITLFDKVGRAG